MYAIFIKRQGVLQFFRHEMVIVPFSLFQRSLKRQSISFSHGYSKNLIDKNITKKKFRINDI